MNLIIEIPDDGKWDFVHRFRNFGEDVFRGLRALCTVSIYEIDASTSKFLIRDVPDETMDDIREKIRAISAKHFFAERLLLKEIEAEKG